MSGTQSAIVNWVNQFFVSPSQKVTEFTQLRDGVHFFDILAQLSAEYFDDTQVKRGVENNVLMKSNVDRLLSACSVFLNDAQEGLTDFSLAAIVDSSAVVAAEDSGDASALETLSEFIFTITVTSGPKEMLDKIRALDKPSQVALQGAAKKVMTGHKLKKAPVPTREASEGQDSTRDSVASSPAAQSAGRAASPASTGALKAYGSNMMDAAALLEENKKLNGELQAAHGHLEVEQAAHEELRQQHEKLEGKYKKLMAEGAVGHSTKERELYDKLEAREKTLREMKESVAMAQRESDKLRRELEMANEQKETLSKELTGLSESLATERQLKLDAQDEASLAKDKTSLNVQRREELEVKLDKMISDQRALEEKLAGRKDEVQQLHDQVNAKDLEAAQANDLVEELRERLSELEAADGMASNFADKTSNFASNTDALRDEVRDLKHELRIAEQNREKHTAEIANKDIEIEGLQTDLAEAKALLELEANKPAPPPVEVAAALKDGEIVVNEADLQEVKTENDTLKKHLQSAVNNAETLKASLAEVEAALRAAEENAAAAAANPTSSVSQEEAQKLQKENEHLVEHMKAARGAARLEQAAIFSAFFECGHRNMQVQQRQLSGAPPVPTGALFDTPESSTPVSFLEKHRRNMEQTMLMNLITPMNSPPRRH